MRSDKKFIQLFFLLAILIFSKQSDAINGEIKEQILPDTTVVEKLYEKIGQNEKRILVLSDEISRTEALLVEKNEQTKELDKRTKGLEKKNRELKLDLKKGVVPLQLIVKEQSMRIDGLVKYVTGIIILFVVLLGLAIWICRPSSKKRKDQQTGGDI